MGVRIGDGQVGDLPEEVLTEGIDRGLGDLRGGEALEQLHESRGTIYDAHEDKGMDQGVEIHLHAAFRQRHGVHGVALEPGTEGAQNGGEHRGEHDKEHEPLALPDIPQKLAHGLPQVLRFLADHASRAGSPHFGVVLFHHLAEFVRRGLFFFLILLTCSILIYYNFFCLSICIINTFYIINFDFLKA